MEKQLHHLLKLIEEHIDLEHCRKVDERYRAAFAYEDVDRPPLAVLPKFGQFWQLPAPWGRFEHYSYKRAFEYPAAMMQNMLLSRVVPGLILKDDSPLAIRNDHGTIQIAALLGGQWQMHEDDYPWVGQLGSKDAVRALVKENFELGRLDGVLPQSTKTLEFYAEQLSGYPLCNESIQISLPDLQGPIDTADILWGSEIFMDILLEPELVSAFLNKIVEAMLAVADYYRAFTRDRLNPLANTQHGYNIPGRLLVRNDSAIMVSPDTYRQMILPHDAKVLKEVGSGSIHFCGNGQHLIDTMLDIPDLRGLDFGQPELMDTKNIYARCAERKKVLTNIKPPREDLINGNAVRDYPTGAVLMYNAETLEDAAEVVNSYKQYK